MKEELYEILYKTEETYWWFVGQRYLIKKFFGKYYDCRQGLKLLDVGCGAGITLRMLNDFGEAHGIDISESAIKFCKKRELSNIKKSNVMDIKFDNSVFDVITALSVFYHENVKDDVKAFKEIYRVLKPGGRLFFIDSAMMCLYGKHDAVFQSIRRYSKGELLFKLKKAGFVIEKLSYFNTIFFPIIYLSRKFNKISKSQPKSDVTQNINQILNALMKCVYKIELYFLSYVNYPFGVNILAIARKPNNDK